MSEKECLCRGKSVWSSEDIPEKNEQYEEVVFDFGKVDVLAEHSKNIVLYKNENAVDYKIKRCINSQLYQHFTFDKYYGTKKASEKLKVIFKPLFPFQKYLDNFKYKDANNKNFIIVVRGESVGPVCQISTNKIYFCKTPDEQKIKTLVELRNASSTKAEFKFDISENEIFKVQPCSGEILPEKYIYIKITFTPYEIGSFAKQLACLVFNSNPIQVTLFGIYTQEKVNIDYSNFSIFPCAFKEWQGFKGYLKEELVPKPPTPPSFSLNHYNLNFGRGCTDGEPKISNACFTNEMSVDVNVKWQKGSRAFKVDPQDIKVKTASSALFNFTFNPDEDRKFFHETFTGQLFWESKNHISDESSAECSTIPKTITIKLQGHSFPENESWLAYIEIEPEIITLPPCLPGDYTGGTFKLKSKGHLPVMYRLIPPKKRMVTMKPSMGILKTFAIVTVMMYTRAPKIYIEEWKIELNGLEHKLIPIYVRTECTLPVIEIGENNEIWFDCVQPSNTSSIKVPIKNQSPFGIRYKFKLDFESSIKFIPKEGDILPNEEIFITCEYVGNPCFPEKTTIKCELQAFHRIPELLGQVFETSVTINTKCSQSFLCSTPSSVNFGHLEWGSEVEIQFWVFNFGISPIYFIFQEQSEDRYVIEENKTEKIQGKTFYNISNSFKISPYFGEVLPGEKLKVEVKGIANKSGNIITGISYKNRLNKNSLEAVEGSSKKILEIEYEATYPTIQILEITEHSFGALFGKLHLWEYLQIDNINNILRNIQHDTTQEVELFLPDCEVGNDTFYINLLLQNVSQFETDVFFKRNKICDCPVKEEEGHVNVRKKVHDCPHREMLSLNLHDNTFYANGYQYLTIFVKYSLPYETRMTYVLHLSNNRNIELNFRMYSIPKDILIISTYKNFHMKLKSIFIGRYVAPVQVLWLYNNTEKETNYQLVDDEIIRMCKLDGFEVLHCLNPCGEIEPYSLKPLLIKFHPIEEKTYEITVPLILGDEKVNFTIEGEGCLKEELLNIQMPESGTVPQFFPIILSLDYINIETMATWSTAERIIFIKNVTKDRLIQYEWKEFEIPDIIKVTYQNNRGILKPKETHSQIIKIETFSKLCSMNFLISCEILDYTQITLRKISIEQSRIKAQQAEDEFTITEKGISYPENKVKIHPAPKPLASTISININTIDRKDIDIFVPIEEQLKYSPASELEKLNSKPPEKVQFSEECIPVVKNLIEGMIEEFVCSEKFKTILKISNAQPPPYYNQFTMEDEKIMSQKRRRTPLSNEDRARFRRKEVEKFFKQPPKQDLSDAITKIITDGVHEAFKLGRITSDVDIQTEVEKLIQMCDKDSCSCKRK